MADAYVLFNPGFGEPGWERAWSQTLDALLVAERPVLATALSRADAARDGAFLGRVLPHVWPQPPAELAAHYVDNPWASTLLESDGGATGASASAGGSQSNYLVSRLRP